MTLREKARQFVGSLIHRRGTFESHDVEFAYREGYDQALRDASEVMYQQFREKLIVDD